MNNKPVARSEVFPELEQMLHDGTRNYNYGLHCLYHYSRARFGFGGCSSSSVDSTKTKSGL